MSDTPLPSIPDKLLPASFDLVEHSGEPSWLPALIEKAQNFDGQPPFLDQSLIELREGTKTALAIGDVAIAIATVRGSGTGTGTGTGDTADYLIEAAADVEFVVAPDARKHGLGAALLDGLIERHPRGFRVWSRGNHPGARALARSRGLTPVHSLLQLRARIADHSPAMNPEGTLLRGAALHGEAIHEVAAHDAPAHDAVQKAAESDVTLTVFSPENDTAEWLELYAEVFAGHPEKPAVSSEDLTLLMNEEWFDPETFLIARDSSGTMVGFVWVKIEQTAGDSPHIGEIYLLGVAPDSQSSGFGRVLLDAGLELLVARGISTALLYVGGDNVSGLRLYHRAGFVEYSIDVMYECPPESELHGGNMTEVLRQGSSVVRSAGEWTETVHEYLHHLRNHGIEEVPLPIAIDRLGRERLGFIEGDVPAYPFPEWVWLRENLEHAARLLRRIHDASVDFDATGAVWQSPARTPAQVICHNDFAPYNFVGQDNRLVGVIDWDTSSPGPRLWDLAYLAYRIVPLTTANDTGADASTIGSRTERTTALLEAYGTVDDQPVATVAELEYMVVQRLRDLAEFNDARASVDGRSDLAEHAALYRRDAEVVERRLRGQDSGQ